MKRGNLSLFARESLGQSLVEFALTLPVLVLILMAIFDMGRAVFVQNVLANAVREGARYGIACYAASNCSCQDIEDKVSDTTFNLNLDTVTVAIKPADVQCDSPSDDQPDNTVRVAAGYNFIAVTPLIGRFLGGESGMTIEATSTMGLEGSG
jgi:Flp pilus assembly protein TadG